MGLKTVIISLFCVAAFVGFFVVIVPIVEAMLMIYLEAKYPRPDPDEEDNENV